jgi:hypothetical protein
MIECCAAPVGQSGEAPNCPVCGSRGAAVPLQTVKALLRERAMQTLSAGAHRFCATPTCEVVYFAVGGQVFTTADVRVPVWQKCSAGQRLLCYCFGETDGAIDAEVDRTGGSDAAGRIREHIAAGRCACEIRNPRGVCCLGDVLRAVKRARAAGRPPRRPHGKAKPQVRASRHG